MFLVYSRIDSLYIHICYYIYITIYYSPKYIDQEKREMLRSKALQIKKKQMDVVKYENEVNKAIKAEAKREQAIYEKNLNAQYE